MLRIGPGVMHAVEGGSEGLELIAIGSDRVEGEEVRADESFWAGGRVHFPGGDLR